MMEIGHNNPPHDADPLRERLENDYAKIIDRKKELLEALERMPETVDDEDTAHRVADFVKQLHAAAKVADKYRVSEKEDYLAGGRVVDGFFKTISVSLQKAKTKVEATLTTYQRKVEAAERARRLQEERAAREIEAAARKEAEKQAAALDAAAAAAKSVVTNTAASVAGTVAAIAAEEAINQARAENALAAAIAAEEAADQARADVAVAAKSAAKNAADLSRSRSDLGSVASLKTFWDQADLDRDKINLEVLRPHLSADAIEKAVRSFIKAGGRELEGVTIFQNTKTNVR